MTITHILDLINEPLSLALLVALAGTGVFFTLRTRFVQFRMIPEMLRLLFTRPDDDLEKHAISPVKAFLISLGARVGTGNLAGVATAIALGGPGAVFWMWVMALLGGVNAFLENTLAQLFKQPHKSGFIGGPAYYITKGLHSRAFAIVFAITIIADFGLTNNMLQSNTITSAFHQAFGADPFWMAVILAAISVFILFGGIKRIAKVSSVIVPFMAIAYILLTLAIMVFKWRVIPDCFALIFKSAFGLMPFVGGTVGTAVIMGFKRGLFSNEAGLGSSPNAAASAHTKHPVTQGLIQAFGIYTDTIIICTCTAIIVLASGLYGNGLDGVNLTQAALNSFIGPSGDIIIAILIFFFAYSSIIANSYYGEVNVRFIRDSKWMVISYRLAVALLVFIGGISTITLAWAAVDLAQSLMAICNITAIVFLAKYAIRCLHDYQDQRRAGKTPEYHKSTIPEIAEDTPCWPE